MLRNSGDDGPLMLRNLRYSVRLTTIAWTLARYDALFGLEALNAPAPLLWFCRRIARSHQGLRRGQRLSLALQALGPSFIKAGQALSTRADLIGDDIARDLAELQDKIPPFPTVIAKHMVEEQLGAPITTYFTSFEDVPVAAASVAQVHFAVTTDGRDVAVKILRPKVEQAFQRDIDLMFWLAHIVQRRLPQYRRLKPVKVVETFANTIRIELDLRFEAAAAEELAANTKNDPEFYVPSVDWERTRKRVLVTERIRGFNASDVEGMKAAGIHPDAVMEKAARSFFNQVFRDGFFHADMHPGNLFVLPDGRLAPVDFGIMGRIDHQSQLILAEILWAFLKSDYVRIAEIHREAGYIPPHIDIHQFAQAIRAVGQPIMGKAMNEISAGRLLGQVLAIAQMFEMEAQPHLLLLQKTMMTAEGVGRGLNPNLNMWQLSEPLIKAWAKENLSPPAMARTFAREAFANLRDMPRVMREAREFLIDLKHRGITLSPESLSTLQVQRAEHQRQWMWLGWSFTILCFTAYVLEALNLL
ncbi:MAG: 2-polyprenylphenol 6-hydroxylase [Rickettsiales bacterium]